MEINFYFIKDGFYKAHPDFVHLLDIDNVSKQGKRSHLCLEISANENKFFIPIRSNLKEPHRPYGRIGHAVPDKFMPNAGLDFRNVLVFKDYEYVVFTQIPKISKTQYNIIEKDYKKIRDEFFHYLNGFVASYQRHRNLLDPLYKDSSLVYFLTELGLE